MSFCLKIYLHYFLNRYFILCLKYSPLLFTYQNVAMQSNINIFFLTTIMLAYAIHHIRFTDALIPRRRSCCPWIRKATGMAAGQKAHKYWTSSPRRTRRSENWSDADASGTDSNLKRSIGRNQAGLRKLHIG